MAQLFLNKHRRVCWNADGPDALHIYLKLARQPDVEYTTMLFKDDVKRLWKRSYPSNSPFPEDDIWVTLYNRGVWEM